MLLNEKITRLTPDGVMEIDLSSVKDVSLNSTASYMQSKT